MSEKVNIFAEQLEKLGYEPVVDSDWVEFDYIVPGGTYSGETVRKAIKVPPNLDQEPPHGIDFSPRFRAQNTGAQHPARSHPSKRFPNNGEHWSRPFQDWHLQPKKDAATYMAHVHNLWMTT